MNKLQRSFINGLAIIIALLLILSAYEKFYINL